MRYLHSPLVLASFLSGAFMLAPLACDSVEERPRFEEPLDAATDAVNDRSPTPDAAIEDSRAPFDPSDDPVTCTVTPCATELAAGKNHFCARMSDGTVRCWGDDEMGATGAGDVGSGGRPVVVAGLTNVTQISAAERTTCARLDDASIHCWGANEQAQLGLAADPVIADELPHPVPSKVDMAAAASRVDVGIRGACALLSSGDVWCWGANDRLQLARTTPDLLAGPGRARIEGFPITRTGSANVTGFALTSNQRLLGWGAPSGREGSLDPDPTPFPLPSLASVTAFATGGAHACAIADGRVFCWGVNRSSRLCTGLPDGARLPTPTLTKGSAYPQRVAVSEQSTCVRMTDGTIQCCGDDRFGQLGTGTSGTEAPVFTRASAFERRAVQVVTSDLATCALVDDGSVECWGGNAHAELGQGTHDEAPHPVPVRITF